jgi:hypothetical protein
VNACKFVKWVNLPLAIICEQCLSQLASDHKWVSTVWYQNQLGAWQAVKLHQCTGQNDRWLNAVSHNGNFRSSVIQKNDIHLVICPTENTNGRHPRAQGAGTVRVGELWAGASQGSQCDAFSLQAQNRTQAISPCGYQTRTLSDAFPDANSWNDPWNHITKRNFPSLLILI